MAAHTKVGVGYNVQVAVDAKNKLIVEQAVTNQVVDMGLLTETSEPAREILGVETIDVVADRGYFKIEDIEACEQAGCVPRRGHSPTAWRTRSLAVAEIKNFVSDADMPTGGGSVASQSECSICCSAIAVVQGCCLFSQTELRGFSKSGSANIPTATAISSGRCSGSQKTVPPHSGQKLNVTVLPLSARRAYRLAMPLASRTCFRG